MNTNRHAPWFLLLLSGVALSLSLLLAAPFREPIAFAVILAILFYPLHGRLRRRIRGRNLAAILSTTAVLLAISLLLFSLGRAFVAGIQEIHQGLRGPDGGTERLSLFVVQLLEKAAEAISQYLPIAAEDARSTVLSEAQKMVAVLVSISAGAIGNLASSLLNAVIGIFILFFLFRDGRSMLRHAMVILPLAPGQVRRLAKAVKDMLYATVYGTLAIAAMQGLLSGIAFWFLGLASPALWGLLTSLCALLPVLGTALVLLPAVGMLFFNGHWIKGLILLAWAVVVVHPVDNVLRPYLIGERVRLSTIYVFFAVLGGLRTFGGLGAFFGPIILAVTVALFTFLREEKRAERSKQVRGLASEGEPAVNLLTPSSRDV